MLRLLTRAISYLTLLFIFLRRTLSPRRTWRAAIAPGLVLGQLPFSRDVPTLAAEGVCAILNMCDEWKGPLVAYQAAGIVPLRVPVLDFTSPSTKQVESAIAFIVDNINAGRTIYLHCKAGRGRSATVALCYLMEACKLSPEEADRELRRKYTLAAPGLNRRKVVQEFAKAHRRTGADRAEGQRGDE
jgi:atypical dual specificity phosphatase